MVKNSTVLVDNAGTSCQIVYLGLQSGILDVGLTWLQGPLILVAGQLELQDPLQYVGKWNTTHDELFNSSLAGSCDLWHALVGDDGSNVEVCIGSFDLPMAVIFVPGSSLGMANIEFFAHAFFYESISLEPPSISSPVCPAPLPPCPSNGTAIIDVWFGTDFGPSNLTNRDAGDLVGELIFLNVNGSRQYLQRYSVEVSTDYGKWGDCSYVDGVNQCFHDTPPHVGRSGSNYLGGSQCGPPTEVGVWYSFPYVGRCGEGEAVGVNGCTWQATLLKMVAFDCIFGHNDGAYGKAWADDVGKAPFPNVQASVLAAFEACDNVPQGAIASPGHFV